jgi:hypothetical protein
MNRASCGLFCKDSVVLEVAGAFRLTYARTWRVSEGEA